MVLLLHAVKQLFHTDIPVDVIRIRDEERCHGGGVVAVFLAYSFV